MRNDFHPCTFTPPSAWLRMMWENGGVPRAFWGKAARVLGFSALATPLRIWEYLAHSRQVDNAHLEAPVFLLGFARSGTTHLQYLMAQDARFGCFTTFQGAVATFALTARGRLKGLMERGMGGDGQTRPMDNVVISLDTPMEEDLGVAGTSHMSFVHQLSFPRQTMQWFDKHVMLGTDADGRPSGGLSPHELQRWERAYLRVLRKTSLLADGKPLLLRNTVNTARADVLLRLFPRAKFVHIVRNPFDVYPSLMHLYRTLLPLYQLDHYDEEEMERFLVTMYRDVMRKYLRDRERIPAGQLAEVRFEDLERDPLGELERLYAELDLPDWRQAAPAVATYLQGLSGYQKNRLPMAQADIDRVAEHWGFATKEWGYEPPDKRRAAP